MLQVHNLTVFFGATNVLDSISFGLSGGEAISIVGANGSGKTTLIRCLVGEIRDYTGEVVLNRQVKVSYLPQDDENGFEGTALEKILSFDEKLLALYRGIQEERHDLIQEYYELGGYKKEDRVRVYAVNFGIVDILEERYADLSRGQQRKVDVVGTLVSDADLMIFDEPINFLDIRGITAFEEGVKTAKRRGKSVMIVSHDRELIDNVADRTLYLERGKIFSVEGGYSVALDHKEREFSSRVERARVLKNKINALQEDMRRRMGWGISRENESHDSSSRRLAGKMMKSAKVIERRVEKRVEELKREKPWIEKEIKLSFPEYHVDRRVLGSLEEVCKRFGSRQVLDKMRLTVETRDRISIMGENGAGKTTLLNLITGKMKPDSGDLYFNASVKVGYVTQGLDGFYEREIFLHNFLEVEYGESEIRQFLGAAKLTGDKVLRPIHRLSYGELMRGAIVKMILERVEFLILDEPTTHLDIESVEVLERLLKEFSGGFIVVSHDRRLISNISDEIYLLKKGRLERL